MIDAFKRQEMVMRAEKIVRERIAAPPDWEMEGVRTATAIWMIEENHEAVVSNLISLLVDFALSEMDR